MFSWKPSLAIGVPEVDAQHQVLFERAASFESAVAAREPNYRLEELFAFLARHAVVHFEAEERIMREVNYPRLAEHSREHADFKRTLVTLMPQWEEEGDSAALVMSLLGFLDYWLTAHVTSSDQRIGDFLRSRDSEAAAVEPEAVGLLVSR
jgi:hemerythrin